MRPGALLATLAIAQWGSIPALGEGPNLSGFSPAAASRQLEIERHIAESLSVERLEQHLEWLTRSPHPPGSESTRALVHRLERELASLPISHQVVP